MVQFLRFLVLALAGLGGLLDTLPALGYAQPTATRRAAAAVAISGRVKNERGEPLPGVVVTVQGKSQVVTTNSAGSFLVSVEAAAPVLQFTCVGYQPQTVPAAEQRELAVTLYKVGSAASEDVRLAADAAAASRGIAVATEPATFPGGEAACYAYLRKNSRYPEAAQAKNVAGSVFVSFVVDEAGRILDAQVLKGCGYGLDEEALRLVRLMPWWTPGQQNGKIVRSSCSLRIKFELRQ